MHNIFLSVLGIFLAVCFNTLNNALNAFRPIRLVRPSKLNSDTNTSGSFFGSSLVGLKRVEA